jgi:hypothetical protein
MPHPIGTILYPLAQSAGQVAKPSTWDNSTWFAMAIALVATVYILGKSRRMKKDPLSNPPAKLGVSQQRAVERDMQNLLVELSEMSRQIGAHLDTRSKKLELLIDEADRKIAQLTSLGAAPNSPGPAPTGMRFGPASEGAANDGGGPSRAADARPEPENVPDPRHVEIYNLASGGMTAFQIADRLGRPKGEIDLILALRPRG